MARLRYDNLSTTLATDLEVGDTTITFAQKLTSLSGDIPSIEGDDYLVFNVGNELVELIEYTSGATTGTIVRGAEGTTAQFHSANTSFDHVATSNDFMPEEVANRLIYLHTWSEEMEELNYLAQGSSVLYIEEGAVSYALNAPPEMGEIPSVSGWYVVNRELYGLFAEVGLAPGGGGGGGGGLNIPWGTLVDSRLGQFPYPAPGDHIVVDETDEEGNITYKSESPGPLVAWMNTGGSSDTAILLHHNSEAEYFEEGYGHVDVNFDSTSFSSPQIIMTKDGPEGEYSWRYQLASNGDFEFVYSTDGTNQFVLAATPPEPISPRTNYQLVVYLWVDEGEIFVEFAVNHSWFAPETTGVGPIHQNEAPMRFGLAEAAYFSVGWESAYWDLSSIQGKEHISWPDDRFEMVGEDWQWYVNYDDVSEYSLSHRIDGLQTPLGAHNIGADEFGLDYVSGDSVQQQIRSIDSQMVTSSNVRNIVALTEAEYDLITPEEGVFYLIIEEP